MEENNNVNNIAGHMPGNQPEQNMDSVEVNKFNRNASQWWDLNGEFKPLHDMNPLRLDYIQSKVRLHFNESLQGKVVLDVGCGGGILSESLAKAGAHVDAIDMAENAIEVAKLHLYESGLSVNYHLNSVEDFAAQNAAKYDVITCLEMLEHVPNPQSVIQACTKLLKPNGLLFVSTINRTAKSYGMAIIGAEYILKLLPKGTHRHDKFIKPSELDAWARNNSLVIDDLTGMHYNPLSKQFWLADGLDVNYIGYMHKPA